MARAVTQKCVECAQLSAAKAKELHGKSGDNCWVKKRCAPKRSRYRNRQKVNEKRRLEYQQKNSESVSEAAAVEKVELPVAGQSEPYACLYIWREKRKNAPIHAIAAAVFQNGSKVLEVEPIHCAEYRKRQIDHYVREEIMGYFQARYGITFFAEEIRLEPIECPIPGCPYKAVPQVVEVTVDG